MHTRHVAPRLQLLPLFATLLLAGCVVDGDRIHGENDFAGTPLTVAELLAAPETHDGQTMVVSGTVSAAFSGCANLRPARIRTAVRLAGVLTERPAPRITGCATTAPQEDPSRGARPAQ